MKHNLKISVSKKPKADGIVACRTIGVRERFLAFPLRFKTENHNPRSR